MSASPVPARPCLLCGAPGRVVFHRFGYPIVRCDRCGLLACGVVPPPEELAAYYSEAYFQGDPSRRGYHDYEADAPLVRASLALKLRWLEKWVPRRGRLLDVGCASGYFLETAREAGWQAVGVDLSAYATGRARQQGLPVVRGATPAVFGADRFDAVTFWDVLEHMPDPVAGLRAAHRVLRAGGVLGLSTGRVDSLLVRLRGPRSRIFNPPQHLFFFTWAALRTALARAGFEILARRTDRKLVSLRYVLHLQSSLAPDRPWAALARRLMRWPVNPTLPVWIPDNMVVFARKTDRPPA